jgi:multiple sugar transport system permease protein
LDRYFKYWALVPALLVLVGLTLYPLYELLRMSVSTVAFTEGQVIWQFSGLDNWNTFLSDEVFRAAVTNTVIFVVLTVAVEMVLGLSLALVASQIHRMQVATRAILMIPILVPGIAIGTLWRLLYNYEFGLFNATLRFVHLPPQSWTGDARLALGSVILVDIWHWTSFVFLLMLAGLESLPQEPIEAARVDGATDRQLLRYIILPLLRPTIMVTLLFRIIFAFKVFDEVYLLTGGGPGNSTEVISLYIDQVFFSQSRMGYGAFLAVIAIMVTAGLVVIYTRMVRARSRAE